MSAIPSVQGAAEFILNKRVQAKCLVDTKLKTFDCRVQSVER